MLIEIITFIALLILPNERIVDMRLIGDNITIMGWFNNYSINTTTLNVTTIELNQCQVPGYIQDENHLYTTGYIKKCSLGGDIIWESPNQQLYRCNKIVDDSDFLYCINQRWMMKFDKQYGNLIYSIPYVPSGAIWGGSDSLISIKLDRFDQYFYTLSYSGRISKYFKTGELVWENEYMWGGATFLELDNENNLILAASANDGGQYITKINPINGDILWQHRNTHGDAIWLKIDQNNNIYTNLARVGVNDNSILIKLDKAGNVIFKRTIIQERYMGGVSWGGNQSGGSWDGNNFDSILLDGKIYFSWLLVNQNAGDGSFATDVYALYIDDGVFTTDRITKTGFD